VYSTRVKMTNALASVAENEVGMDDGTLLTVMTDWTRAATCSKAHGILIPRLDAALPKKLRPELPLFVKGVRRCGKSTLQRQILGHYGIPHKQAIFVNFEDPRLWGSLNHHLLDAIVSLARRNQKSTHIYFFFDEIQNVQNWEKWLHTKVERPSKDHFVVTGSNAHLLSGEIGSRLSGRHFDWEIFPFSFEEYSLLRKKKATVDSFLREGGFPKPLQIEESAELLMQYFDDIVERDIRERLKAKSAFPLKLMIRSVFEACGSELSLRRLAAICGLTADTVSEYLTACENAYLIFSCPFFVLSQGKRLARKKKYYPIDTALRRHVTCCQTRDFGKDFETMVFLALRRKFSQVYYWSGSGEVDFVVLTKKGIVPIQVSLQEKKARLEDALGSFYEKYPQALESIMVTKENFAYFAKSFDEAF
jgi:predicted AAA+ superfamily ATPase